LKGPLLSHTIFGDQPLRYAVDIDILTPPEEVCRADWALRRLGFHPGVGLSSVRRKVKLAQLPFLKVDLNYRRLEGGLGIDLHAKTYAMENLVHPSHFDWKTDVCRQEFRGESIPVLEDYRYGVYLCFHAAKHSWSRIRWLLDIVLFIERRNLDYGRLLEEASNLGLELPVLSAAALSEHLLGVRLNPSSHLPVSWLSARKPLVPQTSRNSSSRPGFWEKVERQYHVAKIYSRPSQQILTGVFFLCRSLRGENFRTHIFDPASLRRDS
jgi:hypothetical protein